MTCLNQIVERCNSELGGSLGSTKTIEQAFSKQSAQKQNTNQFQTIQDDMKRKHTIMEVDSDDDRSQAQYEVIEELGQPNVEEFQLNEEESVEIKRPMSSKKSKSLENINKVTQRQFKNAQEQKDELIEIYKKQYQMQEKVSVAEKEHTRNISSGMKPVTKVTTIDLTKVFNFTQSSTGTCHNPQKSISTNAQKTNYIKKNINYINELNLQLQSSLD